MKLSIIIATFNSSKTMKKCLDSIVEQSLCDPDDIEVIIKDGGSKDDTILICNNYIGIINNFIVNSGKDNGVYDAWNQAIAMSTGDWILFLGSDDYFSSTDAISSVLPYLSKAEQSGIQIVYGKNKIVGLDGELIGELGESWVTAKNKLTFKMSIRHPGCFHKAELVHKLGGFDSSYRIIGDYAFILKALASEKLEAIYYEFPIISHTVGGLSIQPSRNIDVIKETIRLRREQKLKPIFLMDALFLKRLILYIISLVIGDKLTLSLVSFIKR